MSIFTQILPRGTQTWKNEKTHVGGAWHHKQLLLCWMSMLAMRLFIYLNDLTDDEIHFYGGENNGQPPDWYKHYIINFQNYSTHRDAFT